jgi:hypothetical protein
VSLLWELYRSNRDDIAPLLAPLGSVFVGLGTVLIGGLVARAALRQARTATEVARIANRQAEIAAVRHEEQTRADRARRVTDTFSKAVEQLGSEKIAVRVGGIYTLERLAGEALTTPQAADATRDESIGLYWTAMETLTAFVRERAQTGARSGDAGDAAPPTDIAAVLAVIQRRPKAGKEHENRRGWWFDLTAAVLCGARLMVTDLEHAILIGAHLEGANLSGAHLEGANLIGAHLEGANLVWAHLERADLLGAYLEGADLLEAHLEGADLSGATGDAKTRLPEGVARPTGWPAYVPDDD